MLSSPELKRGLQMVVGILKDPKGVHMEMTDSSSSSRNKKMKNFFKKCK